MCLVKLTRAVAWGDSIPDGVGWKVFYKRGRQLTGDVVGIDRARPRGRWLNEVDYRAGTPHESVPYPLGWHVFKNRKDAETYAEGGNGLVCRPVKYRQAIVTGLQAIGWRRYRGNKVGVLRPCIVAKEIYICPLKDKKEKK